MDAATKICLGGPEQTQEIERNTHFVRLDVLFVYTSEFQRNLLSKLMFEGYRYSFVWLFVDLSIRKKVQPMRSPRNWRIKIS